jgi:hypothetical protein
MNLVGAFRETSLLLRLLPFTFSFVLCHSTNFDVMNAAFMMRGARWRNVMHPLHAPTANGPDDGSSHLQRYYPALYV